MKFKITVTLSKILAYLILLTGTVYAFIYKDATVLISMAATSATVIAVKTGSDAFGNQCNTGDENGN